MVVPCARLARGTILYDLNASYGSSGYMSVVYITHRLRCAKLHQIWNINLAPKAEHARIPWPLQTFGDVGGSGAAG
jgi:hypothetical protein